MIKTKSPYTVPANGTSVIVSSIRTLKRMENEALNIGETLIAYIIGDVIEVVEQEVIKEANNRPTLGTRSSAG